MVQEGQPISLPVDTAAAATRRAEALIPTPYGDFRMIAYSATPEDYTPHLALVHPDMKPDSEVIVRIHSECITGDLFGSKRCDCGEQLSRALQIAAAKKGVVVYLRQEGRGIGIINKLKAYQLQDTGLDTIEANEHLGFEIDARHYEVAQGILQDLGVNRIQLLTNNPEKIDAFDEGPITVVCRLPIVIDPVAENMGYLRTKELLMGHLFK
ncbi:GTP cyclohydrolase II [Neolewinella antarctica]|uniref:GTP cyclohydrolase-2 n=1 Tax=Neolewinella antarctica TaxID=442734 RepID=A0ABX0XD71_9BACT|nr:GTP cyclohydrolase II [Neolewinella antarctica]NJC27157.1 3,4-dihydroxy 2-butanone 4-phosphate synthase/GTP cyclohydrolase II [Neolewinella antarctica]